MIKFFLSAINKGNLMIETAKRILLFITCLSSLQASSSTTQGLGDFLAIAIPATAYGTTLYLDDTEGQKDFYKAYGTTMATTLLLKYTVREKRPDTNTRDSFPSGHTSSAMSGATFIHKKYGFKYALPAYIGAIYTGYSRVHVNRHHTRDVIAGAFIGAVSSWYLTSEYKGLTLAPQVSSEYQGVKLGFNF